MRSIVRGAALALTLATLTLAQEAPDPFLAERILPQNALVYLSMPQNSWKSPEYATSNLFKLINHPEIKAFSEPIQKWLNKRKTQQVGNQPSINDTVKQMTGLSLDEIETLYEGPISFALYDVPMSDQHKLDLVFTLGAPDLAKLEKAAATLKENLKQQGNLKEGEYSRAGTTVREFGDNAFRVYYAFIQKTLVVATRQERMDQIVDAAADKAFAGLREDASFKAARARVAPENKHFFLVYLNLGQALKQYRRELGDEALKALETFGVADIPSLAMSMGYDGPHIRERYALMTTRQDRGLLKVVAGGTPVDPLAALVPAGAISYSHMGLNLAELYDVIHAVSKINPDFEQGLKGMLGEYEKRAGFKVRDAFASLGASWTAWSTMPDGGGILPDSISAVPLNDPTAFEAALEKAAKDAGLPMEEMTFRGKKIRYITIGLGQMMDAIPAPVPDFFKFSLAICYMIDGKTLFFGSNPMSLKRHIIRSAAKGKSILEDPKYVSIASRVQGESDSLIYMDLGRTVVVGYGIVEPFLHLARDLARDPETGELVVDLARLPLEETLADLLGGTLTNKRTLADAILLESRSNTGVSLSSGVGYVGFVGGIAAALFIPRMAGGGGGTAQNEMIAEVSLQFIRNAEETFKNSDSDANGAADYWTRDVAGLHSLKDRSGQAIFLLDPQTAAADPDGAARYNLSVAPKNGYFYKMMVSDPDGEVYQKVDGKTNKAKYGVVAYPAVYGATGKFTFITSEAGKTWKKDTEGKPVDKWPGKDPSKEGWALAE
jgi:hypothetical protein